jgi:hypothetical protein
VLAPARSPRNADPLVIAIEGLCYVGKTTLAHALAPLAGAVIIGEYTSLAGLPPFPPRSLHDVAQALQQFLNVEQHRAHTVARADPTGDDITATPSRSGQAKETARRLGLPGSVTARLTEGLRVPQERIDRATLANTSWWRPADM